ncbi:MAG: hypothetical protein HPY66_0002 [Firmicutes bacterium]|nr:hypothetical protein [Bacillota bacterium]
MFEQIKNEKMYMLIVNQIKTLIEEGKLAEGEKLPSERDLANQFGVSRPTIREAITALDIMGLVEVKVGLGTFVKSRPLQKDLYEIEAELWSTISPTALFEARVVIRPQLAKLAALRATYEDLEEIRRILDQMDEAGCSENEIELFQELDAQFHLAVGKAAHSEALYLFEESMFSHRANKLWKDLKKQSLEIPGRMELYREEHREIFKAIYERNPALAEEVTRRHLSDIKQYMFGE